VTETELALARELARHPRRERVVGFVDRLGYLRCVECASENQQAEPVWNDSEPHASETCETCFRAVLASWGVE